MRYVVRFAALLAAVSVSVLPAWAHHVADGKFPTSWGEGLLSGLAHPVIGLDHLAFIIVVGLVSAFIRDGLRVAVSFGAALLVGVLLSLAKPAMPWVEGLVACTVLSAGIALVMEKIGSVAIWRSLAVGAGLLHGYALGGPIAGASTGALAFYMLGLAAALALIMLPVRTFAELTLVEDRAEQLKLQATGGAVAALGLFFVASAMTA